MAQQHESVCGADDRFRVIFDAVNDGIVISDPVTGRLMEVNEPGCIMFGYTKAELIGKDVELLSSGIHPYTFEGALMLSKSAAQGIPQMFEWQCRTRSGGLFWAEVSTRHTHIGDSPAIVAIVRDITERKRAEEALRQALRNVSADSDAKSLFLATMSHELRTPLNAIIGFSDLMLSQVMGPLGHPRYREYIHDIHASGRHLLALINDILDLSRLDAGKADLFEQNVSLGAAVMEAVRMVGALARQSDINIAFALCDGLPDIRGDERRIKQIVLNLLSNAIKFTPAGGSVTVAAARSPAGIMLSISDTGIGIAKEDLPKVLERFGQVDSRLSRRYEGSGLGLPLVRKLTELHGGTLSIESSLGVGTRVIVTFPASRIIAPRIVAAAQKYFVRYGTNWSAIR